MPPVSRESGAVSGALTARSREALRASLLVPWAPEAPPHALPLGLFAVSTGVWVQALHAGGQLCSSGATARLTALGCVTRHRRCTSHSEGKSLSAPANGFRPGCSDAHPPRAQNPAHVHRLHVRKATGWVGASPHPFFLLTPFTQNLYFELEKIAPR